MSDFISPWYTINGGNEWTDPVDVRTAGAVNIWVDVAGDNIITVQVQLPTDGDKWYNLSKHAGSGLKIETVSQSGTRVRAGIFQGDYYAGSTFIRITY